MKWIAAFRALAARLAEDRSGATSVITGISLVAALGFAAFGTDLGVAYAHRRAAQSAADSAAFSGAVGKMAGAASVAGEARAVTPTYGLVHGVGGVNVIVNSPAASGSVAGNAESVEVIVERPMARFFAGVLGAGNSTLRARAVAVAGRAGDACVVALNPTEASTVSFSGSSAANLINCNLHANSSNGTAMQIGGSASLNARGVNLVGSYGVNGSPTLNVTQGIRSRQSAIPDPYANLDVPNFSGCNGVVIPNSGVIDIPPSATPRVWCGGMTVNAGVTVNFPPGVYVIDRGLLQVNGGGTVNATNATFILTSSTGANYAQATINGGANFNVTAPTSGPTAGIAIMQDRRAPRNGTVNRVNGGSATAIRGAVYFPKQSVLYSGSNSSGSGGGCTQLLADTVQFSGNVAFEINCEGAGVRSIGGYPTELVE